MLGLELKTFDRDAAEENPAALPFIASYLWMRMAVGLIGVTLPVLLVVLDWWFVHSHRPIRGSMSAYYHSSSRDVFVGGLVASGVLLITYMAAKKRTYDFVLSTTGGVLLIVVAFLPTARNGRELGVPHFHPDAHSCTTHPGPPLCNGFEKQWGEGVVRTIHQASACVFVVILVALCIVFALREFGYGPQAKALLGADRDVRAVWEELRRRHVNVLAYLWRGVHVDGTAAAGGRPQPPRRRVLSYLATAVVIIAGGLWAALGVAISLPFVSGQVGSTYVGEFATFVSFGIAWLTVAWDLMPRPVQAAGQAVAHMIDSISRSAPAPPR